ncbi:MAG: hypothetical protein JSS34_04220 [Proteobacteria bacterium]|nr:hypothetical protein [Pseudomonadota bacterium]
MIKKILSITVLGISIFSGNSFAMQTLTPDCAAQAFQTNNSCPAGCIWDCDKPHCRNPQCSDYQSNITCPAQCGWSCPDNACVPGNE